MKISLLHLSEEISPDVAQEFIDHRAGMGKRYAFKTQGAFDRQMKIALKSHEVGMTPDALIEFTIDQNWQGINISYTKNKVNNMMLAESSVGRQIINGNTPRAIENGKTREAPIRRQLTNTDWVN